MTVLVSVEATYRPATTGAGLPGPALGHPVPVRILAELAGRLLGQAFLYTITRTIYKLNRSLIYFYHLLELPDIVDYIIDNF